jgi:hypothetical protein
MREKESECVLESRRVRQQPKTHFFLCWGATDFGDRNDMFPGKSGQNMVKSGKDKAIDLVVSFGHAAHVVKFVTNSKVLFAQRVS